MATATATAPTKAPTVADSLRKIVAELGDQFLERREHIEALMYAVLAGQHAFILGPPGTGKSMLVRDMCDRFVGGTYWEILLDRQLGKEEVFGAIDIPAYEKTGKWFRDPEDSILEADIAFVDEVGKAGPAILNTLLTVFNERKAKIKGVMSRVPLITAVGASNELLEPELAAMWDRFLVRLVVDYIVEPGHFAALLASATISNTANRTTVTLAELRRAIEIDVPAVKLPPGVIDTVIALRGELNAKSIQPSDRRWKQCMRLLQASAYLAGRDIVDDDDLQVLRFALWDTVEQIPEVDRHVLKLTSETTRVALEIAQSIEEIEAEIDKRQGQAAKERAAYGGEASFKLQELTKELTTAVEKANRAGRSTARLDGVSDRLRNVKVKVLQQCLNMPPEKAQAMAGLQS